MLGKVLIRLSLDYFQTNHYQNSIVGLTECLDQFAITVGGGKVNPTETKWLLHNQRKVRDVTKTSIMPTTSV